MIEHFKELVITPEKLTDLLITSEADGRAKGANEVVEVIKEMTELRSNILLCRSPQERESKLNYIYDNNKELFEAIRAYMG
jgi:hypothetical protein